MAAGSDTETFEVQPPPDYGDPANPQPVHSLLLIEHAIYLFESIYLEELAEGRGVRVPLRRAARSRSQGATGSMLDPVAIV